MKVFLCVLSLAFDIVGEHAWGVSGDIVPKKIFGHKSGELKLFYFLYIGQNALKV
jgi:hypothetical protein